MRLFFLLLVCVRLFAATSYSLTVTFDYDFTTTQSCSLVVTTGCISQFDVYDLTTGKTALFMIPAPSGLTSSLTGITGTGGPFVTADGIHTFGVTAQMVDGTESVPDTATAQVGVASGSYGNATVAGNGTASSFTTAAIAVAGPNPALVVDIGLASSTAIVSSVSWSGTGTAVQVITARGGSTFSSLWCVIAPAGTGTISTALSASVPYQYAVSLYNNADQTNPCPSVNAVTSTVVQASTTFTPTGIGPNDLAVANCNLTVSGNVGSVTPNQRAADNSTAVNIETGDGPTNVVCNWDTPGSLAGTAMRIVAAGSAGISAPGAPTNLTVVNIQ